MTIKKITKPLRIDHDCGCGRHHMMLPSDHKLALNDDDFSGIWFNCDSCKTTRFIRLKEIDPNLLKE